MTTDIKELAAVLRHAADKINSERGHITQHTLTLHKAADALEALAGEVAQARATAIMDIQSYDILLKRAEAADAERDRLKAALVEQVKQYPDYSDICRKALGGDAS